MNGPNWTTGKLGSGLEFDGVNDYLNVSNESAFDFEKTSPFSVSAWVYPDAIHDGKLASKLRSSGTYDGWEIQMVPGSGKMRLYLVSDYGAGNRIQVDSSLALSIGAWTHFVMTYNGSSSALGVSMYFNGTKVDTTVGADALSGSILNELSLLIGSRQTANGQFWDGTIDEVRIYNRALSASEIQSLYQPGVDTTPPAAPMGVVVN